jgi:hypothetical protein
MAKNYVELPENFVKGLICKVSVSQNGKTGTKELKVCNVKARSVLFIEVDRENRKNVFRKVSRKDIIEFRPTAICEITIRDGVLPTKWESAWDSIGSFSSALQKSFGRPHFSNHSKGWAPKLPSTTNNPVSGFPMV